MSNANGTGLSNGSSMSENGVIRIDMPPPHRDEPKYPREYLKTLFGNGALAFVRSQGVESNVSLAFRSFLFLHVQLAADDDFARARARARAGPGGVRPAARRVPRQRAGRRLGARRVRSAHHHLHHVVHDPLVLPQIQVITPPGKVDATNVNIT